MAGAHVSLKILESAPGIRALEHLPYDKLLTDDLADESDALPFRILLRFVTERLDNGNDGRPPVQHNVWAHLYPANAPNGIVETQFHLYDSNREHVGKLDGETISRDLSGCAMAFALPDRYKWSRGKLIALAKYYFLRKAVGSNNTAELEMLKHGVKISKTFKDDLGTVCREFQEGDAGLSGGNAPAPRVEQEGSRPSSSNSIFAVTPPRSLVRNDATEIPIIDEEISVKTEDDPNTVPVTEISPEEEIGQALLDVDRDKETTAAGLAEVERKMEELRAQEQTMKDTRAGLRKRRHDVCQGKSTDEMYDLGRQVERASTQKRMRLDRNK